MHYKYFLPVLCFAAIVIIIGSCKKNELFITESTPLAAEAQVKIINTSFYQRNPLYQISINGVRVSNTLGGISNPTPFPGGGFNTGGVSTADYLSVNAGQSTVSIATPFVGTNNDSTQLATATTTFEQGKKYSLFFSDTMSKTNFLVVEDSLVRPDSGYARYRFVNLVPDVAGLDLYFGTTKINEAANTPYKGVSQPFTVVTSLSPNTISVRLAGGNSLLFQLPAATATPIANQRVYTIFARGYNSITTTATTEIRRRSISLFLTK